MWDWQEAWFRDRSHGWLLAARSPSEMADRAAVLSGPHGWLAGAHDGSPASIRRLGEQLLDMATQALEAGDPLSAHQLLRPMADLADVLIAEPAEEARAFSTKVDGATPTLLRHISDAPFEIGVLLASGSGTPEVVEALAIRADPRDSDETLSSLDMYQANYALARLIRRGNQLATTRVAAMIADEANPLRIHTAAYVAWANREAANAELDAALLSLLESTDADDLIRSINAVEARGGPLLEPAIRRAIDLARKRPDLAPRIEDALTTRDYVMVLHRHIPELIELAQQPQLRNVGCSLLLVACINAPLLDVGLLDRFEALLDDPAIAHRAPSIREQIGHIRARIEHQQAMEAHRNSIDLGGG